MTMRASLRREFEKHVRLYSIQRIRRYVEGDGSSRELSHAVRGAVPSRGAEADDGPFPFIKVRMPTAEEHREVSLAWLGRIGPTLIETLRPRLHLQTVVFDIHLGYGGEVTLIELNPYGLSDPCCLRTYEAVENFTGFVAFPKRARASRARPMDDEAQRTPTNPNPQQKDKDDG